VLPYRRLRLGPALLPQQLQAFLDGVMWLSLERMSRQSDLDSLLNLLTLPVRPLAELRPSTERILEQRPDWPSWNSSPSQPRSCATPAPRSSGFQKADKKAGRRARPVAVRSEKLPSPCASSTAAVAP